LGKIIDTFNLYLLLNNGTMKQLTFILLFSFITILTFGQTEWAKSIGGTSLDQGSDVVMDNFGNLYTTGFFEGTVDFDPGAGAVNLSSVGSRDFFIAKYDNLGQLIWAKGIGGGSHEHARSIALDASGNIFIAGDYNGLVDFDPGVGFSFKDVKGASDIFVAKYDSQGNFIWAKTFGGVGIESCRDMSLDAFGNLIITGVYQGTSDFDPNGGVISMTSAGQFDAFLLKLDVSGNYVWAKSIQSANSNYVNQVIIDHIGNINIVGDFQGIADFDPSNATFSMTTIGNKSAFFAKYSPQGQFINATMIGGSGFEIGKAIAVDLQDNIYITGDFRGVVDFDPSGSTHFVTSSGIRDIFVAKYTTQGELVWANKIGGTGDDQATAITLDNNNEVFVAGYFNGSMTLSNLKTFTSAGNTDIILARYNSDGLLKYAVCYGGGNGDEAIGLIANNAGDIYNIGWIQGVSNFGNTTLNSAGDRDIYLAKTTMQDLTTTENPFIIEKNISIFPNPSNGQFNLRMENLETEQLTISVIDATGRILNSETVNTFGQTVYQHQFDLTNQVITGLYFVRITSENSVVTRKVFVR
jgi:hypothetical protein